MKCFRKEAASAMRLSSLEMWLMEVWMWMWIYKREISLRIGPVAAAVEVLMLPCLDHPIA